MIVMGPLTLPADGRLKGPSYPALSNDNVTAVGVTDDVAVISVFSVAGNILSGLFHTADYRYTDLNRLFLVQAATKKRKKGKGAGGGRKEDMF